jgi:hypothetical protein
MVREKDEEGKCKKRKAEERRMKKKEGRVRKNEAGQRKNGRGVRKKQSKIVIYHYRCPTASVPVEMIQ